MAVNQDYTDIIREVPYLNAYRNIRLYDYTNHKNFLSFHLNTYSSKENYEKHLTNPQVVLVNSKRLSINAILSNGITPNPIWTNYFTEEKIKASGKDIFTQIYEYLKAETTELAGATDIL